MVKGGTGTLVLGASNSYAGGTLLSTGMLALANNDALGTGTSVIAGSFIFNLSTASTNPNSTWTIVADTLANSCGPSFFASGFNGISGGNPTVGTGALLTATKVGTNAVFNFVACKDPPGGASYQAQSSTNLATGSWNTNSVTVSSALNQSGLNVPPVTLGLCRVYSRRNVGIGAVLITRSFWQPS
jgi:fibronectin-binding autotransporter adhesin